MLFNLHLDSVRESQPCRRPAFPVFSISIPIVFQLQMHLLEALWKIERSLDLKWTHTNCESICWELYNCPFCLRFFQLWGDTLQISPDTPYQPDVGLKLGFGKRTQVAMKSYKTSSMWTGYEQIWTNWFFFFSQKASIFTLWIYICILYM